jgi:hypothetical protein
MLVTCDVSTLLLLPGYFARFNLSSVTGNFVSKDPILQLLAFDVHEHEPGKISENIKGVPFCKGQERKKDSKEITEDLCLFSFE